MRSRYVLIVLSAVVATAAVVGLISAGDPDSPPGPPETTNSYTLEDIYDRLDTGAAGMQSVFTEPSSGPPTGTMHTLDEIMSLAPSVDDTNGATQAQVLVGKTAWGLTSGGWGVMTGTMADNGAVVIAPTTGNQAIAAGYHNGSGYVEGDADLVAGNIRSGVSIFGVDGTLAGGSTYSAAVPKTGETTSYATGDDGDLEMGVAWPNPRFITSTTGIVTDTLTGLVWLKNANCTAFFSVDFTFQNDRSWSDALTAANSLASGYCGLSDGSSAGDWRLPNVREMESLVHYGLYSPALPNTAGTGKWSEGDPFTGVQASRYWSSTTSASNTPEAWNLYMYSGLASYSNKTNTYYVWPVRGGP